MRVVTTEEEYDTLLDDVATAHGYDRDWLAQIAPWGELDEAGRVWARFRVRVPRRGGLPAGRHRHEQYDGAYDPKRVLTCKTCNAAGVA